MLEIKEEFQELISTSKGKPNCQYVYIGKNAIRLSKQAYSIIGSPKFVRVFISNNFIKISPANDEDFNKFKIAFMTGDTYPQIKHPKDFFKLTKASLGYYAVHKCEDGIYFKYEKQE